MIKLIRSVIPDITVKKLLSACLLISVSYLSKLNLLQMPPNCNANLFRLNIEYKYRTYKNPPKTTKTKTKSLNTRDDV